MFFCRIALCLFMATWAASSFAECDGLKTLQEQKDKLPPQFFSFLQSFWEKKPPCGTFAAVTRRLAGENRKGGFKLEEGRPLDVRAAEQDLATAMKSPDVRNRIDEVRRTVPEEDLRLAYEVGIFDDEGFYGARDLTALRLKERLK